MGNDTRMLVLGIETTCDETAAAVVERARRRLAADPVEHREVADRGARDLGGVVPEIAARAHVDVLDGIVDAAMKDAGVTFAQLSASRPPPGPA